MLNLTDKVTKTMNFLHFHRKRLIVSASFVTVYGITCRKTTNHPNDILRLGVAGSLANLVVESMFHFVDTVNVRAKLNDKSISSLNMARKIY